MYRLNQWLLTVAVVALLASPIYAQRRPNPGGAGAMSQLSLLNQESVQKELKLTDDQVSKVKAANQKQMQARQGLRDLEDEEQRAKKIAELTKEGDKVVADVLQPDQTKRLKQIHFQVIGVQVFSMPEVAKALSITDEQKQKLQTIQSNLNKERTKLFQPGADRAEMQKKIGELNKKASDDAMAVFTPEQKESWKKLTGEPFTGKIQMGPGGAGGRRPRNDR